MPLPDFKNEQEFRDNWIAPFLAKLGFMNIKNTHGPGEHGKDFFFTDYDRFGHSRYYAAQVKLGNIGSGGKEINDLLDQVKRCFGVRLRFHKGTHEQRISAVYVMTNGTISEQAKVRIHDWCHAERFGENVWFLDGEQLDNKNRFATYENDKEKRQVLDALKAELHRNSSLIEKQRDKVDSIYEFSMFRLTALEMALSRHSFDEDNFLEASIRWAYMEQVWTLLSELNDSEGKFKSFGLGQDDSSKRPFLPDTEIALDLIRTLFQKCCQETTRLNSRYTLEAMAVNSDASE